MKSNPVATINTLRKLETDFGDYVDKTNYIIAEKDLDIAVLRAQLAECERVAEDLYKALGQSIHTIDGMGARASYVKYKSSHEVKE